MAKVLGFSINIEGTEKAVTTAEELRRAIAGVQKELKAASDTDAIVKLEKELIDLKAAQANVNEEIREQIKARRAEINAVDDTAGAYDKMSRKLNESRKRYKDLAAAGQEFTKESIELRTEITQLDKRLKEIDASVGQFQRNVGGYSEALSQFFPRVSSSIGQVTSGIQAVNGAAGGMNKALGVLFVAVTVFQEISGAITAAVEQGKEFNEVSKRISQTATLTNEALADATGTVVAISRTYQQESRDIVNAGNTLTKEFGIGYDEALTLIEAGFRKGANAQGDFLDQLREYPAQFASAGGSAQSFVDILIRAQNEGIYSDKGIDAVKEFGLRIREQGKATGDALRGAFGEKFTAQLFKGLNDGSITTVQALKQVTGGLRDTQLTAAQTQKVIADVFGGPGEDAGLRFLQLLADVDEATQDVTKSTNEYESQQLALFEANQTLAQSQAELAEFTTKTGTEFAILKTRARTFLTEAAVDVLKFFNELPATLDGASAALRAIGNNFRAIFSKDIDYQSPLEAYNKAFLESLKEVRRQDEEALAIEEARQKAAQDKAKAAGAKTGKAYVEGSIEGIQAKAKALEKAINEAVAGSAAQKNLINALGVQQRLLEEAITKRNRLEFEQTRNGQSEIVAYLNTVALPAQIEFQKSIQEVVLERLAIVGKKEIEAAKKIQQARDQFQADEKARLQSNKAQTLDFIAQGTQQTFDLINSLTAAANQRRNEIFQQQITETEARIAQLEEKAQRSTGIRKRLIEGSIAAERKALEEQTKRNEEEQKRQRKIEKRNALISSIIQGALSVQRALANPPGPPFTIPQAIATGIFAALQTATIAAQPLATGGVVGISGRRVTDRQNMPTRGNGDNVLATVKRGEVVLNQRQQAALGGAQTFRAIRVPGFASGGIASPSIGAPRLPTGAADSLKAIEALDRKTDAINARLDRLRAYVVTEDIARDMRDGESIEIKATL